MNRVNPTFWKRLPSAAVEHTLRLCPPVELLDIICEHISCKHPSAMATNPDEQDSGWTQM